MSSEITLNLKTVFDDVFNQFLQMAVQVLMPHHKTMFYIDHAPDDMYHGSLVLLSKLTTVHDINGNKLQTTTFPLDPLQTCDFAAHWKHTCNSPQLVERQGYPDKWMLDISTYGPDNVPAIYISRTY